MEKNTGREKKKEQTRQLENKDDDDRTKPN